MLSHRAAKTTALQDLPWRFAPGSGNRYDPVHNPEGVVVFGTAENPLIHPELANFIEENVTFPPETFTYRYGTNGGPRLPTAMAAFINRHFSPHQPVEASNLVFASALTAVHEMLGFCLGEVGDGILVTPPIYGRFELDFGNKIGMEVVYADMDSIDPFNDADAIVEKLGEALVDAAANGTVVRALLIVNPNNPLGRCYPPSTLKALMRFCQEHGLHFISDEVYAMSVYETEEEGSVEFTSALSIDLEGLIQNDRMHVLYGMSKDFGSAGLKIGCLMTRNALLRKAMLANTRFHGTSGPSVAIATAILEDEAFVDKLLNTSRKRLASNRTFATIKLKEAGIDWHKGGNAGFFLYIDLSPWLPHQKTESATNPEHVLAEKLLQGGVGLHPCEEHSQRPGWFRIVFSLEKDVLEEGLRRLIKALGPKPQPH